MFTLFAIIGFLAVLPAVAWRWGVDSRDGHDWSQAAGAPARRGPVHVPESWVRAEFSQNAVHARH